MAKRLTTMTWDDMQSEMSIAGNPEKVRALGQSIMETIASKMDATSRAEMTNIEFALQRILAEVKLYQRMYDKGHFIKSS
jgi:hypothetical protein